MQCVPHYSKWMSRVAAVRARRSTRCWVTNFSQRIDPMLLQEIFQTPFCYNNKKKLYKKTTLPVGGTPETHTLHKRVVVEYLNVSFR